MPITNGTISLLRRVRTGDFEHIEPHVTMTFSVEPNEDAATVADATRQIVDTQYKALLGITSEPEKKTRATKAAEKPAGPLSPSADATAPPPSVAPVPPSAPVGGPVAPTAPQASAPAALPSPVVPPAPGAAFNAAGQPAVSPTALVAPLPAATEPVSVAGPSTPATPAVAPGALPVVPAAGPVTDATALSQISDETMAKKCQDKTDELNALYEPGIGLQRVVAVIRQYIDPPGRATQIPHARRQEFLTTLAALA